jgi:hypothetical protein
MYALFFDARGYLAQIPATERISVIEQFYATQVVPEIVKHYTNARPSIPHTVQILFCGSAYLKQLYNVI